MRAAGWVVGGGLTAGRWSLRQVAALGPVTPSDRTTRPQTPGLLKQTIVTGPGPGMVSYTRVCVSLEHILTVTLSYRNETTKRERERKRDINWPLKGKSC